MRADRGTRGRTDGVCQSTGPLVRRSPEWEFRGGLWVQVQRRLRACLRDLRRVVGMPDYQEYLRHLRLVHPTWPIPSEREFFELYLQTRYGDGPTRCC
jgi:uncharacterized short protein YbdD (DUF466 family)